MFLAVHKELGNEGLILAAVSKARLRRQLVQIGQDPNKYDIRKVSIIAWN